MPFLHIRSLPFSVPFDVEACIVELSHALVERTDIELQHLTITWDTLKPGYYAVAGRVASAQPQDSFPLLVDFVTPDFYTGSSIAGSLTAIADSLASLTGVSRDNIFIQHRTARSGQVFDRGEVLDW